MTPFKTIYRRFFANITDYKMARLDDISLEQNLELWLNQAVGFYPNSRKDLYDVDDISKCFNEELNNTEIEALAKFMAMSYMNTHLMREEYLSEALVSKDYRVFSSANKLKALQALKDSIKQEANTLVSRNSYSIASIKEYWQRQKGGKT